MSGYGRSGARRMPREMADRVRPREMRTVRSQVRDEESAAPQSLSQRRDMVSHRDSHSTGEANNVAETTHPYAHLASNDVHSLSDGTISN